MNLNKIILTSLVGITAATGAFAEVSDDEIITSKKYTDTKFQEKISAYNPSNNEQASLLTDTTTKGQVGKRAIFTGGEYDPETQSAYVPTMGAVMASIGTPQSTMSWTTQGTVAHPTNNDKDATESYSTSFDDADNTWPDAQEHQLVDGAVLAQGLALKQNKLTPGTEGTLAQYNSNGLPVTGPAIYDGSTVYAAGTDAAKVATAGFVETKQDNIGATASAYSSTAHPTYASGSLVATTGAEGTVTERGIATARKTNTTTGALENGDWVPTVDMLVNEVEAVTSQIPTLPTGTQNTLANYDNTGALGNGIAIANSITSGSNDIPTSGVVYNAVDAKQDKKECVQWVKLNAQGEPTNYYTDEAEATVAGATCWLWGLPS